ncbi:hypothetical protein LCGC14_1657250 [marine sediment metagenome]|uniref:Uncharacterized protein n=1 Tax=marine sediment metagenome TaxID=412755 RepID=A0A0F9KAY0_9ZZZZ
MRINHREHGEIRIIYKESMKTGIFNSDSQETFKRPKIKSF